MHAHATCQELFPYFSLENLGGSEAVGRLSPRRSLPALPGAATPGKGRRDGDLKEGNRLPTAGCRPLRPPARSAQLCWLGLRGRVSLEGGSVAEPSGQGEGQRQPLWSRSGVLSHPPRLCRTSAAAGEAGAAARPWSEVT